MTEPVAWAGVTAVRLVALTKVTEAAGVPPNSKVVEAVKSVPVRVTVSPPRGVPLLGETEVKAGGLLKLNPPRRVSEPFPFVTVTSTRPAAWAGVTAVRVVALTKVTEVAGVPPKSAVVVAVKSVPVRVTVSPPRGVPLLGDTEVRVGGLLYVNPPKSVSVPLTFVTVTSAGPDA